MLMKMTDFIEEKLEVVRSKSRSIREEAFIIFLELGTFGAFFGLVMTIINAQWKSLPTTFLTFAICVLALVACRHSRNTDFIINGIVALVGCVVFPPMYLTSGAIDSAMFIWFVLIVCLSAIVLNGKARVIICSLQVVLNLGASALAYCKPEIVSGFMSERERFSANMMAFIVTVASLSAVAIYIISRLKKANEELDEARRVADLATRSKSMFLAAMSHEIRTPLNAIINLNEDMFECGGIDDIKEDARDVQFSASVLAGIIDDVLDFSKIDQGHFSIKEEQYTTKSLFDNFEMLSANAKKKGLSFEVTESHHNPLPLAFYGDSVRVNQIGYNIISNAIKYTEKGGVKVGVSFIPDEFSRYDGWLKITVTDTGIGVKETDIPHLFEAFERVDAKRNNHIQGTGLGLAITKSLVDTMHGMIKVSSVYGKGSTFIVTIPQKMADGVDLDIKDDSYDFTGKRILVCDDNALNLKVSSKILSAANAEMFEAESGENALEILRDNEIDLIYMDYRMPIMDGKECMEHIRDMGIDVPVIVVTADVADSPYERYKGMGFDDFLAKPINRNELYRITQKYIQMQ